MNGSSVTFAQISDCHLFAQQDGLHCQVNVYQNLITVLRDIQQQQDIDFIVFTGDLSQDHSEASYQNFVQALQTCQITMPVYFLPGNHDEPNLLEKYLKDIPFQHDKVINLEQWQLLLLSSKSDTPAGFVAPDALQFCQQQINNKKAQLLLLHHHPVNVGYFIDRHGLENKAQVHRFIEQNHSIKAVACGHVHQAITKSIPFSERECTLYTCPATSIQFDPCQATVASNGQGPGYRLFTLNSDHSLASSAVFP